MAHGGAAPLVLRRHGADARVAEGPRAVVVEDGERDAHPSRMPEPVAKVGTGAGVLLEHAVAVEVPEIADDAAVAIPGPRPVEQDPASHHDAVAGGPKPRDRANVRGRGR